MTPNPWIVYVRVSTDEQAATGASLDAQEQACRALLTAHGHEPVEVVRDPGASGKNLDRPGIGGVLRRIEAGEVAGLCVYAIDRLTRRNRDLMDLVELFERQRVELISVRERVDTSGPMGRFVLGLIGGIAQLERETIAQRVKMGMAHKKAQGGFLGRAPAGTIAVRGSDGLRRLHRDAKSGDVVARVWPMLAEGRSLMDAAEYLNGAGVLTSKHTRWSRTAIAWLVASRAIVGVLVDEATWKRAQAALSARHRKARPLDAAPVANPRTEHEWTLGGLCWCASCGSAMTIGTGTGRGGRVYTYLRCSGRKRLGTSYCSAGDLPYVTVEAALIDGLRKRIADGAMARAYSEWLAERRAAMSSQDGRLQGLRTERDKLARRLEMVWEVVEAGGATGRAARDRLGEVQAELERVDGEIAGLEAATEIAARDEAAVAELIEDIPLGVERLADLGEAERRAVLAGVVRRIDVRREEARLTLVVPGGERFAQRSSMVLPTGVEPVSPA